MTDNLEAQMQAAEEQWLDGWKHGPQRTRWTSIPLQIEDQAPEFELPDQNGETIALSSFWKDQPALILFWRHYGCGCGVDRAKRLINEYEDYQNAKANVVIISEGEPRRSAAYARKYKLPEVPILSDPPSKVYEAYGLLDGRESQILFDAPEKYLDRDPQTGLDFAKERKEDDRPLVDSSWLLPGEFVVDVHGVVQLAYRYNYCEDFPDHRVHLAGIRDAWKAA